MLPILPPVQHVNYCVPALSRADMVARLEGHGWTVETTFNQRGPILLISGPFYGTCWVEVPVRLNDDHSLALSDVYATLSHLLADAYQFRGTA